MWNTFKIVLGFGMMIIGGLVALVGIGFALFQIIGLYQENLSDAMNSQVDPKQVQKTMIFWVAIGGVGALVSIIGSFLSGMGLLRALKRALVGGK
jgi:hypothetical protein